MVHNENETDNDNEDSQDNQDLFNIMNTPQGPTPVSRDPFVNNPPLASIEEIETIQHSSLGKMNVQCSECSAIMWNEVNFPSLFFFFFFFAVDALQFYKVTPLFIAH